MFKFQKFFSRYKEKSLRFLKDIFSKEKKFVENFISLFFIQATNFIIPVITLPYLVRTIGIEKFGAVSYALTIMAYMTVFIDYGFMMSATRQVAIDRNDLRKLSLLFSTVTIARFLLFFISILVLIALTILTDRFKLERSLYLYGIFFPLGVALMPTWLYQGLEQMKHITYLNVISKIITICLLFTVVNSPKDYIYILGIYGLANVITGSYAIYILIKKNRLKFLIPSVEDIASQYTVGFNVFATSITVSLVNNANVLILANFVNDNSLGNYGLAEKIIFAGWQVLAVFSSAVYPVLCRLAQESHEAMRAFIFKIFTPFLICIIAGCVTISFFAAEIIYLVAKADNQEAVSILRVMIFVPVVVCLNIPAYQTQLAHSITKESVRIYSYVAIFNVICCVILSKYMGAMGAAITMLLVQTIITVSLYSVIEIKHKQYSLLKKA